MYSFLPKYISNKAIGLYIGALLVCNVLFFQHSLSIMFWAFGIVEVVGFFYFANVLTLRWASYSDKKYTKKLFQQSLIIRAIWVLFSYWFYSMQTGQPFEWGVADAMGYHESGLMIANLLQNGKFHVFVDSMQGRYSDMGYATYLGIIYWILGGTIITIRLFKAILGAYTCVLIYRLSRRNFGETVGRMAGIFCMLIPTLILYSGLHLKEVEMVFLTVAFMERADWLFRNRQFNFLSVSIPLLLAASLFFLRTVLGATAVFAFFTTLIFSSDKLMGNGKRLWVIVWVLGAGLYFAGGRIANEVEQIWQARSENQSTSMEWRSERKMGNKFSKYASGALFAPMIVVMPFPTVVDTRYQENQRLINGGNYVKNILGFFVLLAMFTIIKEKKWREYLLIGSFVIGYLAVLAMSAFAQSERFHQPVLPFELILAAYGITVMTKKTKKYFSWWMMLIFVAIVVWSWFKLAGRGMA